MKNTIAARTSKIQRCSIEDLSTVGTISDSLTLQGSSVIVQAQLPSRSFEAGGRRHEYHDGMQATAAARVRSQSILVALVPGLKALSERNDE